MPQGSIYNSEYMSLCSNGTNLVTRDNLARAIIELDLDGNGEPDKADPRKAFEAVFSLKRTESIYLPESTRAMT